MIADGGKEQAMSEQYYHRPDISWLRPLTKGGERRPSFVESVTGCWIWQGHVNNGGYPQTKIGRKSHRAHRVFYEHFVGAIPEGMTLDHLCGNRKCVNPAHLEPTTIRDNTMRSNSISAINARKTHCIWGHSDWVAREAPYENQRRCRACRAAKRVVEAK